MRWVLRTLSWLLVLAIVAAAFAAWFYVRRAEPKHEGELRLPGLRAEVGVDRDEHGIPTIKAGSLHDAMFALGVVHAQDRLWQLETHKRIGSGRLAELFGEPAVESDRFLRVLGVRRAAERQWANLKGDAREALEAYAAGINAVTTQRAFSRPPEMLILGAPIEPWTPVDSLAWATMMAWDLGGNWNAELLRLRLASRMDSNRIREITPPYPGDAPLVDVDFVARYRELGVATTALVPVIDRVLAAAPSSGVEGVGSNNWVLAGSRTTTGHPLLANDPHLKLSAPALWYFVRIDVPGMKVAGASMPGLPTIVLGQNEHLAWGFTNTAPDVQDLYLERFDTADASRVDTPDGPRALEAVEEVIRVKGKPDVRLTARSSRHGPLISDAGIGGDVLAASKGPAAAVPPQGGSAPSGGSERSERGGPYALAMRWTALDDDADAVGVALAMMRAASVDEFVRATRRFVAPMQNMVVADRAGRIGMVAPGRVPLRGPDHDLRGWVPAPGWDARYDWTGTLDVDATPREFDPPRGWIATANQRIHDAAYPHFITSDWAPPFRQQRIEQLIEAKPRHGIEDLRAMHADVKSLAADPLLPWLKKATSDHALAAAAQAELRDFDGVMAADRAAPLVYWAWLRQLTRGMLADEIGAELYRRTLPTRTFRDTVAEVLARDDAWWCDDKSTPASESCTAQSNAAFGRALDELQARLGSDVKAWRWGTLHQARSEHRPFSRVKWLARFFELRTPVGGDTFTVNVSRVAYLPDPTTGDDFLNEHGPSLRAIYDVSDPRRSLVMHSTGQSGLPWSAHYRDFVERWARVDYVALWPSAPAGHSLRLAPGR
jgi:penicillin amidase